MKILLTGMLTLGVFTALAVAFNIKIYPALFDWFYYGVTPVDSFKSMWIGIQEQATVPWLTISIKSIVKRISAFLVHNQGKSQRLFRWCRCFGFSLLRIRIMST